MINLDDISTRVDRGQYVEADVQALLGEAQNPDSGILDRIGKGFRNPGDIRSLYSNVEQLYASKFGRPTTAQRFAADQAATVVAKTAAEFARLAASQAAANAQVATQAAWVNTAQTAQQQQQDQVSAAATVDRFKFTLAASSEIVNKHKQVQDSLVEQLGDAIQGHPSGPTS